MSLAPGVYQRLVRAAGVFPTENNEGPGRLTPPTYTVHRMSGRYVTPTHASDWARDPLTV